MCLYDNCSLQIAHIVRLKLLTDTACVIAVIYMGTYENTTQLNRQIRDFQNVDVFFRVHFVARIRNFQRFVRCI